jgi:hypothetical protein
VDHGTNSAISFPRAGMPLAPCGEPGLVVGRFVGVPRVNSLAKPRCVMGQNHVVSSGVPQMGLCAASAVGSGVMWVGKRKVLERSGKAGRELLGKHGLWRCCPGSIYPTQSVLHGKLHYSLAM